jgi:hypothetical protein
VTADAAARVAHEFARVTLDLSKLSDDHGRDNLGGDDCARAARRLGMAPATTTRTSRPMCQWPMRSVSPFIGTAGLVPLYKYHRRRPEAMYDEVPHRHGPGDSGHLWFRYVSSILVPPCPLTKHRQTCLLYWTSWKSLEAATAHARPAR